MPARSSAAEFTHAPCPSRLGMKAGRSGTTVSSAGRRGRATEEGRHGPAATEHPLVVGMGCRVRRDRLEVLGERLIRVRGCQAQHVQSAPDRVDVRILETQIASTARSTTSVDGPIRSPRSWPTATMRPPDTATAEARERTVSAVKTGPPVKTRSA